ncbi:DUF1684 domain-containing protein [Marinicella rhabdoformis]|uniref:DUF1684 domain-containing protein n=1 Tax=Marinicella rhabdoformis TaxID=2580566 RepID=UPI0012AEC575|nr:DUF1684 domain-containing protein [Marinicella rhabdoformis]
MFKTIGLILMLMMTSFAVADYPEELQQWKNNRVEALQKPHDWLSLVGLSWLKKGANTIGSDQSNDIVLPHGPSHLGAFVLTNDNKIHFQPKENNLLKANGELFNDDIEVFADSHETEAATALTADTFKFVVVERGKLGVRIWDSRAKTRTEFQGLEYFPTDPTKRVVAQFTPYEPVKMIPIVNVLGILTETPSPGRLDFILDGESYSIDALDDADDYYIIFADKTNGKTTYGPGRFIHTESKVDENGQVIMDFNKAYNPPCAFTAYSTCSLPPRQNRLPIEIRAGEKKYGDSLY